MEQVHEIVFKVEASMFVNLIKGNLEILSAASLTMAMQMVLVQKIVKEPFGP